MSDVVWKEAPALSGDALVKALAEALHGHVSEAFLFGSHARGEADADSDIDLVLVTESELPFVERGRAFFALRQRFGAMDLIVHSPEEWRHVQTQGGYVGEMLRVRQRVI